MFLTEHPIQIFNRGSMASRIASPGRLYTKTVRKTAPPAVHPGRQASFLSAHETALLPRFARFGKTLGVKAPAREAAVFNAEAHPRSEISPKAERAQRKAGIGEKRPSYVKASAFAEALADKTEGTRRTKKEVQAEGLGQQSPGQRPGPAGGRQLYSVQAEGLEE